jgi:hypothetical protein
MALRVPPVTRVWPMATFGRMDPAGIPALIDAIRHLEGCAAAWVESVPVHETREGKTV